MLCVRVQRELWFRIVCPYAIAVQEPPQSRHLIRQIHDNDLHFDFEVEFEDVFACFQGLLSCGDEHVSLEAKSLEGVDHLAKFGAPRKNTELCG